jgi:hypothetical protein
MEIDNRELEIRQTEKKLPKRIFKQNDRSIGNGRQLESSLKCFQIEKPQNRSIINNANQ